MFLIVKMEDVEKDYEERGYKFVLILHDKYEHKYQTDSPRFLLYSSAINVQAGKFISKSIFFHSIRCSVS
jgi:hypothetical protein